MSFNISKQDFQQMLDFSDDHKVRFLYIITHHNADGSFHLGYSGQKTATSLSQAIYYYGNSTNPFFKKETIKKNLSEYKFHVVGYCKNKEELCAGEIALNKYLKDFYKDQWANKALKTGCNTSEGFISIMKDNMFKQVKKDEVGQYLSEDWILGNHLKGLITLTKNGIEKKVKMCDLDQYLSEGWVKGNLTKGLISITKNGVFKKVKMCDLDQYLSEGWVKGNLSIGTIWIAKDGIKKRVKKEDLDTYLRDGWIKGNLTKGLTPITKDGVFKRVGKEELETYLSDGWIKSSPKKGKKYKKR